MMATYQRMGDRQVCVLATPERCRKFETNFLAIGLSADDNELRFHRIVSDH
jgi:hypothetical protein